MSLLERFSDVSYVVGQAVSPGKIERQGKNGLEDRFIELECQRAMIVCVFVGGVKTLVKLHFDSSKPIHF